MHQASPKIKQQQKRVLRLLSAGKTNPNTDPFANEVQTEKGIQRLKS